VKRRLRKPDFLGKFGIRHFSAPLAQKQSQLPFEFPCHAEQTAQKRIPYVEYFVLHKLSCSGIMPTLWK
jgi:hypothetical protein